ncbi:MAG: DUF2490 domain-containing protein [Chitinophagaceae bacterium]|nr:DUF2490 domain-containing protein [Chitinophagaceae bacterium]
MIIIFGISASQKGFSQLSSNAQEVWPAIDAYLRLNQKWRIYATTAATKMNESSYADGAIGIFGDYFTSPPGFVQKMKPQRSDSLPGKFLWIRFGYQYSATPPSAEDPFSESMIVTEANGRFYLPEKMLMTIKNRFDWRFKDEEFNLRYRPRMTIERDMRTQYLTFTAYGFLEYFGNFGNAQVDRLRSQLGVELRVTRHINYEIFWNHQFANEPEVQSVDAFGMTLKIYMDKNDFKNSKELKKIFGKKDKKKTEEINKK